MSTTESPQTAVAVIAHVTEVRPPEAPWSNARLVFTIEELAAAQLIGVPQVFEGLLLGEMHLQLATGRRHVHQTALQVQALAPLASTSSRSGHLEPLLRFYKPVTLDDLSGLRLELKVIHGQ